MAALRLATIQAALVGYLTSAALPMLAGIPIAVSRHGEEVSDETVTQAMDKAGGLCIVSVPPFVVRKQQAELTGSLIGVRLNIYLVENPTQNTGGGLNRDPMEVVEAIWRAAVGKPRGPQGFNLGDAPMDMINEASGMRLYPIEFLSQFLFQP